MAHPNLIERAKEFGHKHKKWEPFVFFSAGFCFDALLLHRIDDPLMLIHQALYLTLAAFLIAWDLFHEAGKLTVYRWAEKPWRYREGILHFLLGTLLNVYTIFYFKSGSFTSSLSFLMLLVLLLILNEARPAGIPKHALRNALFGLCLISYMNIVVSILVGSIGTLVFLLAIAVAYLIHSLFVHFIKSRIEGAAWKHVRLPFVGIAVIYMGLYFLKVLPPVPLSIKYIGLYHEVSKQGDVYKLGYTRSKWRFWENGDETFEARPGDKVYCYIQVFSPARFKEQLFVRWKLKDPKLGWQSWDAIPLSVVGGREEGYRGYTQKTNYTAGTWRVSVESADGREVGRINFEIVNSEDPGAPIEMKYDEK